MKLAYIIGTYPELTTTFVDREIRILREMGHRIQTLSIRSTNTSIFLDPDYKTIQKETIYLIPIKWRKLISAHLHFGLLRPITYLRTLIYLVSRQHPNLRYRIKTLLHFFEGVFAAYYLLDEEIEHIHAHFIDRAAIVALSTSRLLNIPYSLTAHADEIYEDPILPFEKISESKFTITVSEFNKKYLLENYPGLKSTHITVLHPWVDLSNFQTQENRVENTCFRIISVGRLVENKGHQYLIEACHHLHNDGLDFTCKIIGEGPLYEELATMITHLNLGNCVHLLGGQPQSEVIEQLRQSDLFVLAAIIAKSGKRDGMPVALAEAMAVELPVISSDIVGISEMVHPAAGVLVPPKDPVALAAAIKQIWDDGHLKRKKMGAAGRRIISEDFDLYKGISQLSDLFLKSP